MKTTFEENPLVPVSFAVEMSHRAALAALAREHGVTVSRFVRGLVLAALEAQVTAQTAGTTRAPKRGGGKRSASKAKTSGATAVA